LITGYNRSMAETLNEIGILNDLEPTVERLLERHLHTSKEWFPHKYIPHRDARDFDLETDSTDEFSGKSIDDATKSALLVNLLTEDNLPYYFRTIERMFGADGPWGTWVRRWTAEEGRHSMAIFGYLAATHVIDLEQYERNRMEQVSGGKTPEPKTLQHGFVYLALQELATRISHRNTGERLRAAGDEAGGDVMARVSLDENLHQLFYRDLAEAAFENDPDGMMLATLEQVLSFEMPGGGIPDFDHHARKIAAAGIYDLAIHHNQILVPVVENQWKALTRGGLSPEATEAQDRLGKRLAKSERVAKKLTGRQVQAITVSE
jgi:acyl-[acyl-carrier-protein] desaturase